MSKTFYFFRHGETDWNKQKKLQGHMDIPLNELGVAQAQELAQKLTSYKLEVIYSSDLCRASKTAELVAKANNQIDVLLTDQLREANMGDAEGMSVDEAIKKYGRNIWLNFVSLTDWQQGFPGGETKEQSFQRFDRFIKDLLENCPYQRIGICSHGGAIRNFLLKYLPPQEEPLEVVNCSVFSVEWDQTFRIEGPLD